MAWCLTKTAEKNLREALRKDGDPQKMVNRGTEGRLAWFTKHVGAENAERLNYLFETKMLLKSQQRGLQSFVKYMGGSTEIKTDFLTKVGRVEKALSKTEVTQFLETYVSRRLGISVSEGDYKNITKTADKLNKLKESFDAENLVWKSEKDGVNFGATQVVMNNFVESLKNPEKPIKEMLKDRGYQFKAEAKKGAVRATGRLLVDTAKAIADNSVSLVASFDDSFVGRQGAYTLLSGNPKIWGKAFVASLSDFKNVLGNKKAEDALMATVLSDPLYITGEYDKARIIDRVEEQYPTSLPERLPVVGKVLKASEVAFKNSGVRMRTELYKKMRAVNLAAGVEMTTEQVKGLGKVINSLTARGDLGRLNNSPILRLAMWAPKMLKGFADTMTAHTFSDIPKASKKIALNNLARIVLITAIIEGIATAIDDDSTEFDPRSSDFLAIKVKDTRFKFLPIIPQLITLMARMLTGKYKSSTTGEIKEYGSGFAETSKFDTLINFFVNKAPPATRSVIDITKGRDFEGNEPTFSSVLVQAGVPISIQNLLDLAQNPTIDAAFGAVADFFGIGSNTFRDSNKKTELIPTDTVIKNKDFMSMVQVYAKAIGTDPETAFNRIFTGQVILQVSDGGIIVVNRQDVKDSQAFKKQWVKEHGGKTEDMKQIKLDHTIPNKLGGEEKPSNWQIVPNSVWSSYTKVENALIRAVKDGKVSLKEAQKQIVEFKEIDDNKKRKERGEEIIDSFKKEVSKIKIVREVYAAEKEPKTFDVLDLTDEGGGSIVFLKNDDWVAMRSDIKSGTKKVLKRSEQEIETIYKYAKKYNIPPSLMMDMALQESTFNVSAQSKKSTAGGLFQFLDKTWEHTKDQGIIPQNAEKTDLDANVKATAYWISKGYLGWWSARYNKDTKEYNHKKWSRYYTEEELKKFVRNNKLQ